MSLSPVAVIKFGGELVADAKVLLPLLKDVKQLQQRGWNLLLCHGGGPQANVLQERLGIVGQQIGGRRITDLATLQVMKYVLAGEVNVDVVAAAMAVGLSAVGISGVSAGIVRARRRPPIQVSGGGTEPIDFGLVGEITEINTTLIEHLWCGGYLPVLNTLALDVENNTQPCPVYNINADTVAAKVACALKAEHLFLVTGVPGVLQNKQDPSSLIPQLTSEQAKAAIAKGIIVGGMIPKVEEALRNLEQGVGAIHILGADALLAEALTPGSQGTVLIKS